MKAILTSSLGGSIKVNGKRIPSVLIEKNGLLDKLKSFWPQDAKVLIVCADPTFSMMKSIINWRESYSLWESR